MNCITPTPKSIDFVVALPYIEPAVRGFPLTFLGPPADEVYKRSYRMAPLVGVVDFFGALPASNGALADGKEQISFSQTFALLPGGAWLGRGGNQRGYK